MKELKESAAQHFSVNPKVDVYHATRDGQCFENWHDANEHSKTLGNTEADRHIEEIKRADCEVKESKKATK